MIVDYTKGMNLSKTPVGGLVVLGWFGPGHSGRWRATRASWPKEHVLQLNGPKEHVLQLNGPKD